ncbi:MAG: diacylglycerol kinase [Promicromonosporaceae bacterium]|nr:diacylglycerol kinase [Promicromonosporaceae bacterium]
MSVSTPTLRLGVVINPTAGRGRGRRAGPAVLDALAACGHDVWDLSGSTADLGLEHARRAVAEGLDVLVVVGGDGMIHLGLQAVAETGTPLGIVAVGTGNDFASKLGLPTGDTEPCLEALLTALAAGPTTARAVDAIRVTGAGLTCRLVANEPVRWVAGAVSAGLDAAVNERANAMVRPRGSSRYVVAAFREVAAWDAWDYRLTFEHVCGDEQSIAALTSLAGFTDLGPEADGDGRRLLWDSRGALVTAANGSQIGGGIPVAPSAQIDDGLLDIVIATDVGRKGAIRLFPMLLAGKHLGHKKVRVVRAKAIDLEPAERDGQPRIPSAFGDGEHLGALPLRAEVRPGALLVLTP